MEIRSYRAVFDLERRIYRVDSLRLNPGGIPVRGLVYFAALAAIGALLARLPLLRGASHLMPWYLRDVAGPAAAAALLAATRIDGRPFHVAFLAIARRAIRPTGMVRFELCTGRARAWQPPDLVFVPDGSEGVMRALVCVGPGTVLVSVAHRLLEAPPPGLIDRFLRRPSRAALIVEQQLPATRLDDGKAIALAAGARMLVRPSLERGVGSG
jgi:hypothetical protein